MSKTNNNFVLGGISVLTLIINGVGVQEIISVLELNKEVMEELLEKGLVNDFDYNLIINEMEWFKYEWYFS